MTTTLPHLSTGRDGRAQPGPLHALTRHARGLASRLQRWLGAGSTDGELEHLDDATLRDLGLARSELSSVRAELDGQAPATRRAVLYTLTCSPAARTSGIDSPA